MSTDLPPEAYTREILQEAFNWLQEQPEPLRSSVQTPERLVSLYRKSQRLNDHDAPVSSKKFISDLKNLASSLDEFNGSGSQRASQNNQATEPQPPPPPRSTEAVAQATRKATLDDSSPMDSVVKYQSKGPSSKPLFQFENTKFQFNEPEPKTLSLESLDSKSQEFVEKTCSRLNLSSTEEALRVLIKLGYEKLSRLD
jgi:hypothetical protein